MNPFLGVVFHWLGGLAAGSFYVPFRGVRRWSWETSWLISGVFSWIFAPWFFATLNCENVIGTLSETPPKVLFFTYLFGVLWGVGGLTFGLAMRYLGLSLGMAVALGYCTVFGMLIPPLFKGEFVTKLIDQSGGRWVLVGLAVCVLGIVTTALAGRAKEREMNAADKQAAVKEFNFKKGVLVATFSGIMSACFAFGLAAGDEIGKISISHGTPEIWSGLPTLIVVMFGGFTTNCIWCLSLNFRNGTGYQYFSAVPRRNSPVLSRPVGEESSASDGRLDTTPVPLAANYGLSALAGTVWYFQFFFYSMGETQMGEYKFSSWTLHMASIIIFSSIWGLALREWRGASSKARRLLFSGLAILVVSTVIVGYGNNQKPSTEQKLNGGGHR
jgi:L-rhamnose-H+ transport protein